ncbi:unnamed protein product [Citrullus colocynthis]|uniref:Uncharacterized protein n=1 Tax=Citrullus colocynthis TaxID=252529 RepID=A0ABP0Y0I2_9ROSI
MLFPSLSSKAFKRSLTLSSNYQEVKTAQERQLSQEQATMHATEEPRICSIAWWENIQKMGQEQRRALAKEALDLVQSEATVSIKQRKWENTSQPSSSSTIATSQDGSIGRTNFLRKLRQALAEDEEEAQRKEEEKRREEK